MYYTLILPAFGVILGLIMAYFKFSTKLSILPSGPIDVSNPFSTPFILKNESLLPIYNVRPHRCIIRNINNRSMGINVNLVAPAITRIASGETTTFILPVSELGFENTQINYINIEIVVFYCAAFIPFYKKEKHVRFVTIKSKDGNLKWIPKSMSE